MISRLEGRGRGGLTKSVRLDDKIGKCGEGISKVPFYFNKVNFNFNGNIDIKFEIS